MYPDHTPEAVPLKQCSKCKVWKPATVEYFRRGRKGSATTLQARCKACDMADRAANAERNAALNKAWRDANKEYELDQKRAYYEANRARIAEGRRKYYEAHKEEFRQQRREYRIVNADRIRAQEAARRPARRESMIVYLRAYHLAHKEEHNRRAHAYYAQNKDRAREQARAWRSANKERFSANIRTRKARKRNAEGRHTGDDIKRQYDAQRGKCYYCGVKVGDNYHVDHVIPLSRGGSNSPENLVIACPTCNTSKQDKLPHEWPQGGRLL